MSEIIRAELVNPYETPLYLGEEDDGPTPEKFVRMVLWACAVPVALTLWPVLAVVISLWEANRESSKAEGVLVCGLSVVAIWVLGIVGALWWGLLIWMFL